MYRGPTAPPLALEALIRGEVVLCAQATAPSADTTPAHGLLFPQPGGLRHIRYGDRVTSWSSPSSTSSDAPDQENNETPCEPRRARRFAGTVSAHPRPPTGFSEVM
ncbi:hypothetical protein HMPREF1318_0257 [Actinomyces massiliensis F0489]|uniref:Uncharacterized protein n=1 Tax=Actinomyces massiliensis F0489 TaxID=1125718 RepID=J0X6S1_9ACTO|nr:hypothetical protein HMPREF1318_0257 [Actinomyces massiliensis F0489]